MNRTLLPTLLAVMLSLATGIVMADPVARAQFTSGISDREPVDSLDRIAADSERVWFFTDLHELEGNTITHRWIFDGETHADVSFVVGGPRWRVWSSKSLIPAWHGEWTVEVRDQNDNVLGEWQAHYGE